MGTISAQMKTWVDSAFGSGQRTSTKPEIGFVLELRPRRLSDNATVRKYVSVGHYRDVRSLTPSDATTLQIDAGAGTVTRSSAGFMTVDGFWDGMTNLDLGGWSNAGNNAHRSIASITDTVITFTDATGLVNEGPTAGSAGVYVSYWHAAPPRLRIPRLACSIVNEGWGTERGGRRPAPDSDQWIELEQFRTGELESGEVRLIATDHDVTGADNLDSWVTDYAWGDADAFLWVGRLVDAWTSWEKLFPFKVASEPGWNRREIVLLAKAGVANLNYPTQTSILTADQVSGTLAAFGDTDNRPAYGLAFGGLATVEPASGYTELGEVSEGLAGTAVTLETGWNSATADTSPSGSWEGGGNAGMVAVELEHDGGGSPITAAHHTTSSSAGFPAGVSQTTASITPTANSLQLLWVASNRYANEGDPSAPTVTGNGLTWVQVATILYASGGSGYSQRARLTLFRALGATPSAGAVTIDWGAESQNEVAWSISEFDNVTTTGVSGADAVVQSVTDNIAAAPNRGGSPTIIGQTLPIVLGHALGVPTYRTAQGQYIVSDAVDGLQAIDSIWETPGVDIVSNATLSLASSGFFLHDAKEMVADVQGEKFNGGVYDEEQGAVVNELFDRNSFSGINSADAAALTRSIGLAIPADNPGIIRDWVEFGLKPDNHPYLEQDGSELRLFALSDPTGQAADVALDYASADIADIERVFVAPPTCRVRVGYQRQWKLLSGLDDGHAQEDRLFTKQSWKYAPTTGDDATVLASYPNALRLSVDSPLYSGTDAQSAATAIHTILSTPRELFRVRLAKKLVYSWIGTLVSLTYPAYGLNSGKVLHCVGVETDLAGFNVWLLLWG